MSKLTFEEARNIVAKKWCGNSAEWESINWDTLYPNEEEQGYLPWEALNKEAAELLAMSWANEAVKDDREKTRTDFIFTSESYNCIDNSFDDQDLPYPEIEA